jgi:hypothetical protein
MVLRAPTSAGRLRHSNSGSDRSLNTISITANPSCSSIGIHSEGRPSAFLVSITSHLACPLRSISTSIEYLICEELFNLLSITFVLCQFCSQWRSRLSRLVCSWGDSVSGSAVVKFHKMMQRFRPTCAENKSDST